MRRRTVLFLKSFFVLLLVLCIIVPVFAQRTTRNKDSANGVFKKNVQLYKAKKKDPYTVYFPIEVKEPGRIQVKVQIANYKLSDLKNDPELRGKKGVKGPRAIKPVFQWRLVDSRLFNKNKPMEAGVFKKIKDQISKAKKYHPGLWAAGKIGETAGKIKNSVKRIFGKKKKKKAYKYAYRGTSNTALADQTINFSHVDLDQDDLNETKGQFFLILQNYSTKYEPVFRVHMIYPAGR